MATETAYYLPELIDGWLGASPADLAVREPRNPSGLRFNDVQAEAEEVVVQGSARGIVFEFRRDGWVVADFAGFEAARARTASPDAPEVFEASQQAIGVRLKVLNAHLVCLMDALHAIPHLHHPPVRLTVEDLAHSRWDGIPAHGGHGFDALERARESSHYLARTRIISEDVLQRSLETLDRVITEPGLLDVVDVLGESLRAWGEQNYSLAATTSWAVSEVLLRRKWTAYIGDQVYAIDDTGRLNLNSEARSRLMRFRASDVEDLLVLVDRLTPSTRERLARARRARNHWLHGLENVDYREAERSIGTAFAMLEEVHGIELKVATDRRTAIVWEGPPGEA